MKWVFSRECAPILIMSAKGLQSDSSESKHFARIIVLNTLYQVQDSYILTIWQENDV